MDPIENQVADLQGKGYYVDFKTDSNRQITCVIRNGYDPRSVTVSSVGTGLTMSDALTNASKDLSQVN